MTDAEDYRQLKELRQRLGEGLDRWGEISEGQLVMMMSPVPRHGLTARRIIRQLEAQLPAPLGAFTDTDAEDALLGKLRLPDVFVTSEEAMDVQARSLDAHEITLAIEIVSKSNPENDYVSKTADYPAMGIPHYLIVDPRDGTCLHQFEIGSHNGRPAYLGRIPYKYGDVVPIGDLRIDTGNLPLYDDAER